MTMNVGESFCETLIFSQLLVRGVVLVHVCPSFYTTPNTSKTSLPFTYLPSCGSAFLQEQIPEWPDMKTQKHFKIIIYKPQPGENENFY